MGDRFMRCTIKDVAKLANTSTATVSLVLNNKPGVKEKTRQRVLDAAEKLSYRPNQIARSLINQKTNTIGLIISDIHNPFYGDLAYNMQKEVDKIDCNLILGISNNKVKNEKRIVDSMIKRGAEGIIIVPARDGEGDLKHLYDLQDLNIPFVFITSAYQGIRADTVMTDLEQATYELTSYLISRGEKKIIFAAEDKKLLHVEKRIDGYRRAFKEHGLKMDENWISEIDPDIENGMIFTRDKILNDCPDAIIAINAFTAMGIMKILKDHNISIPDDISVTCFDDLKYAVVLYTPLTLVTQPLNGMCQAALEVLNKRLNGDRDETIVKLLPGELIIRESTK